MPGLVRTVDGEIRVYSDEEAAELLGCLEEDVARWCEFGLVDYVPVGRDQLCITHDEVVYLRKLGKHPQYKDWPYDRLLWKRYEITCEQQQTAQKEEQQKPAKVRRRQVGAAWNYEDYGAETERDFSRQDEEEEQPSRRPERWRQSLGMPKQRSQEKQEPAKRLFGAGASREKKQRRW